MKRMQRGMTIIEILGALTIASIMALGLSSLVDASVDDVKGQKTALHQEQVANAARRFIDTNYADLLTTTAGGTVATITVAQLIENGFLSNGFSSTNTFGQTPCVLVRQPSSGKLHALVATYGGRAIPERDIRLTAMHAGQGGGYISTTAPDTARGASWSLVTTDYRDVACNGTTVLTGAAANDGGHLASSLFYTGPGQLSMDFLYRNPVPGRPELNQMSTPLHMVPGTGAQAVEDDATDPRCTAASGTGKIAASAAGQVLSCEAGVWRRQGVGFWKEPAETFATLPATGNNPGDVRMETEFNRAFTWTGSEWRALAIDQNGDFFVPGTSTVNFLKLNQTVVRNASCSDNGTIARDADGLTLSCQSGKWRNPMDYRLTNVAYQNEWTVHGADGGNAHSLIDLTTLPGSRPLYLTGYALCYASSFMRAYAYINMLDATGPGFIAGGCLSRPDSTGVGVRNKGVFGLQEIPENVTHLLLHLEVQDGAPPGDYINLVVKIYNSE